MILAVLAEEVAAVAVVLVAGNYFKCFFSKDERSLTCNIFLCILVCANGIVTRLMAFFLWRKSLDK